MRVHSVDLAEAGEARVPLWRLQRQAGIELVSLGEERLVDMPVAGDVPHLARALAAHAERLLAQAQVDEAQALGLSVKPVVPGPVSQLWQLDLAAAALDQLDTLAALLSGYGHLFAQLAARGVEWLQLDEPILALELPLAWRTAFERVYNLLQREPLRKLVASPAGALGGNLGLAASLPVEGLHVELARTPEHYASLIDRLPSYKVLSLGLLTADSDNPAALTIARHAWERLGERLWLAAPRIAQPFTHAKRAARGYRAALELAQAATADESCAA